MLLANPLSIYAEKDSHKLMFPEPDLSMLFRNKQELLKTEPLLLDVLRSLNQIGSAINRVDPRDHLSMESLLKLIAENATRVVSGASTVIYAYDEARQSFEPGSRVSAGEWSAPVPGDEPRPEGMGRRAIEQRRRILSYEEKDLEIHPIKIQAGARTVACFPLVVAEQTLGVLYVYLHDSRSFSELELLMLENFVNHAAMAIYQMRQMNIIQQDLERKKDELNRLRRAGLLISSRLKLEETLEAILQMALEVTNARYGILRLLDKDGQNLVTFSVAGDFLGQPLVNALPIDSNSVMGWVARARQPARVSDLREEPWSEIYYPFDTDIVMRSELAVPLIDTSGRLEGVLNLESPNVGAFTEEDSHLLQALATQAVLAIQEVRLLDALQEVARILLVQSRQQVFERLVGLACDLLNAAASSIWLLEGDQLVLQAASIDSPRPRNIPLKGSLTGEAIQTHAPVISDDVRSDPRFNRPDLARAYDWTHALVVPMQTGDTSDPIGAFSVYNAGSDPGRLDWDKKVLTCLAHYAALAVLNEQRQVELGLIQEQKAMAETFAAVGDIAANLLHNLNNKVGTIPVRVQGIQDKCSMAVEADPYLQTNLEEIERSASEAMETVRQTLSHLHSIELVPVNVATCVRFAIKSAKLPAGVQVQTKGLDDLPLVVAGEQSLALVFTNLLENASDAMNGAGTILIQGSAQRGSGAVGSAGTDGVRIAITDNGPGIPPELHDRIFEFNFSGRASTRPSKLGFGLWWVKTVMARLGGSVSVESTGKKGTTFWLSLPRAGEV